MRRKIVEVGGKTKGHLAAVHAALDEHVVQTNLDSYSDFVKAFLEAGGNEQYEEARGSTNCFFTQIVGASRRIANANPNFAIDSGGGGSDSIDVVDTFRSLVCVGQAHVSWNPENKTSKFFVSRQGCSRQFECTQLSIRGPSWNRCEEIGFVGRRTKGCIEWCDRRRIGALDPGV